jgi:hypothetical protein
MFYCYILRNFWTRRLTALLCSLLCTCWPFELTLVELGNFAWPDNNARYKGVCKGILLRHMSACSLPQAIPNEQFS